MDSAGHGRHAFEEAFRFLRTALRFASSDHPYGTVAVTSAASELIFNPNAIVSQITVNMSASGQCNANTMPAAVATPLPPGKRW